MTRNGSFHFRKKKKKVSFAATRLEPSLSYNAPIIGSRHTSGLVNSVQYIFDSQTSQRRVFLLLTQKYPNLSRGNALIYINGMFFKD